MGRKPKKEECLHFRGHSFLHALKLDKNQNS